MAVGIAVFILVTHVRWPAQLSNTVSLIAGALLGAAVLIIFGSLLYNTLYFERYWRNVDSR